MHHLAVRQGAYSSIFPSRDGSEPQPGAREMTAGVGTRVKALTFCMCLPALKERLENDGASSGSLSSW